MQLPYNRLEEVELTPSKLNFYLAQCSRNHSTSRSQSRTPLTTSRARSQSKYLSLPSQQYQQLMYETPRKSMTQRQQDLQGTNPGNKYCTLSTNDRTFSCNGPTHLTSNLPLYHSNDCLDEALIQSRNYNSMLNESRTPSSFYRNDNSLDRQYYKLANSAVYNPSYNQSRIYQPINYSNSYKQNNSQIIYPRFNRQLQNYSPSRPSQNFNYFNHHENCNGVRKKTNWRVKPKTVQKKNVYYLKAVQGYNQLSSQMANITKQLKNNSKRLQSLNCVYDAIVKANQIPKTRKTLKRVNFKFGDIDEYYPREEQVYRGRPRIYYEDKIYNDPKYIIWHPMYYRNSSRKY